MPVDINHTYGFNYEPLIPSHQPVKKGFEGLLGIHMWQVFTALTLILTVASSLIYFNSIVPQNANKEFIDITKTKTTLYNQSEYIKTYYENNYNKNLIGYQLTSSCYADVEGVDNDSQTLQTNLAELNEQQRYIDGLRQEFETKNYSGEYAQLLMDYSNSLQSYLTEVVLIFQKQDLYKKRTLEIQQEAAKICSGDVAKVSESLDSFGAKVDQFPVDALETLSPWVDNARSWQQTTEQLVSQINEDTYTPEQIVELVSLFQTKYIGIFSVAFDYETYRQKIDSLYTAKEEALKRIEEFELAYISKNKIAEGNTVFVSIKNSEEE